MQTSYGLVVANPTARNFGLVGVRRRVATEVEIANAGRAPVTILSARVEGVADYLTDPVAQRSLASRESVTMRVVFAPVEEGDREATLVLDTDSEVQREVRVALGGFGVLAMARPSSDALDFGRIELGSSRTLPVGLTNDSGLPVTMQFSIVGPDAAQFSADGPTGLPPHGQMSMAVRYSADRLGPAQATLVLVPCENCDPIDISLSGTGIDSALVFDPPFVDFGSLDVDRIGRRSIALRNVGDLPVALRDLRLAAGSDPGFRLLLPALPPVLDPAGAVTATVELAPSHLGGAWGTLEALSDSMRWPRVEASLSGVGGGPEIGVSPLAMEFGDHVVGSRSMLPLRIQNNGGSAAALEVRTLALLGDPSFSVGGPAAPFAVPAGGFIDLPVYFAPVQPGRAAGVIEIGSNDGSAPLLRVTLGGGAITTQPCVLAVTPSAIDFGTLPPNRGAVLGFRVENRGADLCAIKNFSIVDDGGGVFRMGSGTPAGFELRPGRFFVRHVSFKGAPSGAFRGTLAFEVNDPARPRVELPLAANVQTSCLALDPTFLDWGLVHGDCGVPTRKFTVTNTCAWAATVTGVAVGEGTAPEFEVVAVPPMPMTLVPGGSFEAEVAYRAVVLGESLAPLYVSTPDVARPLLLPLLGENWPTAEITDAFIQQGANALDVLFVVDNSESMVEEQPRLRAAVPAFVSAARSAGLDLHVGVTTTGIDSVPGGVCPGGVAGGEAGRLFPADGSAPRVLTLGAGSLESQLASNTQVGTCHFLEKPFEAMRRALSAPLVGSADDPRTPLANDGNLGFHRDAAALAVVFVSDEDDHSDDDVSAYATFLRDLKGPNQPERLKVLAIAPTARACASAGGFPGGRYAELARRTGGSVTDVCETDYGAALQQVAQLRAAPQQTFALSEVSDGSGITVAVNGVVWTRGWRYDAGANAVVFDAGSVPPAGARITVTYVRQCR